jgi:DNA-binding transcriptional regulator PaaX
MPNEPMRAEGDAEHARGGRLQYDVSTMPNGHPALRFVRVEEHEAAEAFAMPEGEPRERFERVWRLSEALHAFRSGTHEQPLLHRDTLRFERARR